ncbi:unnamed protein product [Strongylus vulgaris]|uniref:Uncharacterized protein n=1 Tax=Strongylus vulgaris TaxID=40348 RepID=A0A3P7IJ15_STRVU|nr:unnamed protein product [Strongylus vulgaris]
MAIGINQYVCNNQILVAPIEGKAKHDSNTEAYGSDDYMDSHSSKHEEMDVTVNAAVIDDDESGNEAGSSGEDMAELDYESDCEHTSFLEFSSPFDFAFALFLQILSLWGEKEGRGVL